MRDLAAAAVALGLLLFALGLISTLRFHHRARERERRALRAAGRRVLAEIPTADGLALFVADDGTGRLVERETPAFTAAVRRARERAAERSGGAPGADRAAGALTIRPDAPHDECGGGLAGRGRHRRGSPFAATMAGLRRSGPRRHRREACSVDRGAGRPAPGSGPRRHRREG